MCLRRLHRCQFVWPEPGDKCWQLSADQWQWLIMGVDWQRLSTQAPSQWLLLRDVYCVACKRRRSSLHCIAMNLLDELARTDIDAAMLAKVRALVEQQQAQVAEKVFKITAPTHELAYLKRIRYGKASEVLSGEQRSLFEEAVEMDLAAIEGELESQASSKPARKRAGRQALPQKLPRIEIRHEPESCACGQCGANLVKIGEDVSEQLDVESARFFVHRHIRPQYACRACDTVTAAAIPPRRDRRRPGCTRPAGLGC
jgi:transposase